MQRSTAHTHQLSFFRDEESKISARLTHVVAHENDTATRTHHTRGQLKSSELAGTLDYGLRYTLDPSPGQPAWHDSERIKVFVDSSFASEGPASRSGGVTMYGGAAIAWWSRKQGRTTRSSTDSEITALDEGARRALWLRQIGMAMGIDGAETIEIFEDNAQAVGFANDTRLAKRTKYIDIKYHAVRDDVRLGDLKITPVATGDNLSDAMTKALGRIKFTKFRELMGVVPCRLNARY